MSNGVTKLIEANLNREVHYPEWLANVIIVKKTQWEVEDVRRLHRPE